MLKGARVVRGWVHTDGPEGGDGHLGTVIDCSERNVTVLFDTGKERVYEADTEDIFIYDLSPTGIVFTNKRCDGCGLNPVIGTNWKCNDCEDYDLCVRCYHAGIHDFNHVFKRMDIPGKGGVVVGSRQNADQTRQLRGFFPGAKVMRGKHWEWGDQDGGEGCNGFIQKNYAWVGGSLGAHPGSGCQVKWERTGIEKNYRTGFQGFVDLVCTAPTVGGRYYKEHLPTLGKL